MADVFVSYSRKDAKFARKLVQALADTGREMWVDWSSIPYSEDWWQEICTGIDEADNFLFIISPDSLMSMICNKEVAYAREHNKRIIPLLHRDVLYEGKFTTAFDELITTTEQNPEHVKTHTRLLLWAREWERQERNPSNLLKGDDLINAETWLATSTAKNPLPLALHQEYIEASRRFEDELATETAQREQRIRQFRFASIVLLAIGGLAVVAAVGSLVTSQNAQLKADMAATQAAAAHNQEQTAVAQVVVANAALTSVPVTLTPLDATVQAGITQIALADQRLATATNAQGAAEQREADAVTAVAIANATLTPIPPTLTQAAVLREDAEVNSQIMSGFANLLLREDDSTVPLIQSMDELVARYPEHATAYITRAIVYSNQEDYDAAINDLTLALELDPQSSTAYQNRANLYANAGENDKAIADFDRAIEVDPQSYVGYLYRANYYNSRRQFEAALADMTQAIEFEPQNFGLYTSRAEVNEGLSRHDAAIADFAYAIELDPQNAELYNARGQFFQRIEQYEDAIADFTRAIELDPAHMIARSNRASAYDALDLFETALEEINTAIEMAPEDSQMYNTRGSLYHNREQIDAALADFERAIELDPTNMIAHSNRVIVLRNLDKMEAVLEAINTALEIDPQNTVMYNHRGSYYFERRAYRQAIADYSRTIELNPNNFSALFSRAAAYNNMGLYGSAIGDYNRLIELDPHPTVYHNRGYSYDKLGKDDAALANFSHALSLDPEGATSRRLRAAIYIRQGQFANAIDDFTYLIDLDPQSWEDYVRRADLYNDLGLHTKAIADYTNAYRQSAHLLPLARRGLIFSRLNQHQEAFAAIKRAILFSNLHPFFYTYRGLLYEDLGLHDRAIRDYTHGLEAGLEERDIHLYRARAYLQLAQWENAKRDLVKYVQNGGTLDHATQQFFKDADVAIPTWSQLYDNANDVN